VSALQRDAHVVRIRSQNEDDPRQREKGQRAAEGYRGTERLLRDYREANTILVALPNRVRGQEAEVRFAAEELADHIVAALERRVAKAKAELRELGVEDE